MAIVTISNDDPLSFIKEEDNITRSNLEANPLTVSLAVPFSNFLTQTWQPVRLKEEALEYALALATARILYADSVLNGLVKKLDSALLMITNKDRTALLYVQFFGAQRPFEVAAGVLGPQLEKMRNWVPLLAASPHATLKAIGTEIESAVAMADAAVKAKATAESDLLMFETTGERAQLIDAYNALRKSTYGELGKIKHQHPELPNDFADTFFRHESKRAEDRMSLDQLQTKIDTVAAQLAVLEKKRQAMLEKMKADADAKIELERKQKLDALEAKKKEREALDAHIAKLEGELVQ
jgi:hypothetical protein